MTSTKGNFSLKSIPLINIVFSLFPISFILGNLIININFLLFCCLGFFHLRSKILIDKLNFPINIIFLFFLLVLFSTGLNFAESLYFDEYEKFDLSRILKSILFFRFFIILLIVYLLSDLDIINYKYFFISASIAPILISIDVIFQYTFGFNIIGLQGTANHNSSFFGDELISGGYVQNFSFFSILFLTHLVSKNNNLTKIGLTTLVICTLATGILLSGNRMPFFLFLFGLFLVFILSKNLKKILLICCCGILVIFGSVRSFDKNIRSSYDSFFGHFKITVVSLSGKIKNNFISRTQDEKEQREEKTWKEKSNEYPERNPYTKMTLTALEAWKSNMIFGNSIKSFRVECQKIIAEQKRGLCSNHPHNYYIEILTDLGLAGIILTMLIVLTFIVFLIKNYKVLKKSSLQNLFLLAAIISLFLEVFPIKSSGSIFTTNNATYIILMVSIIFSYKKLFAGENFK